MDEDDGIAPEISDDPIFSNGSGGASKALMSGEQMDVEAYAALYSGRTKICRLLFIAERCGNQAMELEALRMAFDEIKKGEDSSLYREVAAKIGGRLGPQYELDQAWADSLDRRAELRKEKLDNELNGYRVSVGIFRLCLIILCFGYEIELVSALITLICCNWKVRK